MGYILLRMWQLTRTRVLWGWRFKSLGARSVVGRCRWVQNPSAIHIDHHTSIGDGWVLADLAPEKSGDQPKIRIGSYCNILHDFQCNSGLSVEIQDCVLIAPRVFITDSDHVIDQTGGKRTTQCNDFRSKPVIIEHDCWLGVNSVILKGVRVGHHSIVGANAVVTRDVPPFTTVAGSPARPVPGGGSTPSLTA